MSTLTEETLDIITALKLLVDYARQRELLEIYREEIEYICVRHCYYRFLTFKRFKETGKLDLQVRLINEIFDFLDKEFPSWSENHYVIYSTTKEMKDFLRVCDTRKKMLNFVRQTDGKGIKRKKKWLRVHSHRRKMKEIWKGFWHSDEKMSYLAAQCLQVKKSAPKILKKKLKLSALDYHYYTAYLLRHKVDDKTILIEPNMEKTLRETCSRFLRS